MVEGVTTKEGFVLISYLKILLSFRAILRFLLDREFLPLQSQYIFSLLLFMVKNRDLYNQQQNP